MKDKLYIAVETRWESVRIDLDEVVIIERRLRKVFLLTTERSISFYDKIKYIRPLLGENFFEILDGCFINLERMKEAKDGVLVFDTGYVFPVSSRSFVKAKRKHFAYYRRKQLRVGLERPPGPNPESKK